MHNRNYCCYRHFKTGKHDPSCTHCFSHVPLGVINPPHNPPNMDDNNRIPPLQIRSKPFRIQNRTHDYNQVQHKQSLPKRLKQPRVYVQKLVSRFDKSVPLLPIKHSGSEQYQLSVKLFRKIGEQISNKTKKELFSKIKGYAIQKNIFKNKDDSIFLNKQQFIDFLMSNFPKFRHEEAEEMWNISYNQLRFKDRISAQAFVYNFNKFYLQLQNYNNTFSQAALRQRVIDLRVLMFDWFNNDVCIKYNMKDIRDKVHEIQDYLKLSQDDQIYCDFHLAVQKCKKIHIKMRFLAETFFNLTDNKFLDGQKLKQALKQKIEQKARKIETSRKILRNFFETNDFTEDEKFAITDILQFCKQQNCNQKVIADIISWIQGFFDYLYYYRDAILQNNEEQSEDLGLNLNFQTRRLQCANILHINAQMVRQYDHFLQILYDEQVQIAKNLTVIINEALKKMPHLEGPKKQVVQCNFVAETLLRFIRGVDLAVYWYVYQIIVNCQSGDMNRIRKFLKQKPSQEQIKKNMKGLFTLPQLQYTQTHKKQDQSGSLSIRSQQAESKKDKVLASIKKYNKIKEEGLMIKVKPKPAKEPENEQQKQPGDNIMEILKQPIAPELVETKIKDHDCCEGLENFHINCKCGSKYWFEASKEVNDTISTIQSLESRIFSLLNFQC